MDPVRQQLRLLGQNRPLRAVAIGVALFEAMGDDADSLMLEALVVLADRRARLADDIRAHLERGVLVAWDRLSVPARALVKRQHQATLRRVLEGAALDPNEPVRRQAMDLARALATERDHGAWGVLRVGLSDESTAIVRAAAEAIAHAAERLGIGFPAAEPAILAALDAFVRHRSEKILLVVAEQADRAPASVLAWLGSDPSAAAADPDDALEVAQHAMRSAAKRVPSGSQDRLVPVWLGFPCLAPVASRRLQQASELSLSKAALAGKSARASAAMQAWGNLLAEAPAYPGATFIGSLQRIGPEPIAEAIVALGSHPSVLRLVLHACRSGAQREAALIRVLSAREPSIRLAAVQHLARCPPTAASDLALAGLAYDEEPVVAAAGVVALARFSSSKRHALLDPVLGRFMEHRDPGVRLATQWARRNTDPVGDLIATAATPARQPLAWRAPVALHATIARDAAQIARVLEGIATDAARPAMLRTAARRLLNRVLPLPDRARSAGRSDAARTKTVPTKPPQALGTTLH